MQLDDLVPSIENMSDEELRMRLIELRKRREKVPTKKLHKEKVAKTRSSNKAEKSLQEMIENMDQNALTQLLLKLEGSAQ